MKDEVDHSYSASSDGDRDHAEPRPSATVVHPATNALTSIHNRRPRVWRERDSIHPARTIGSESQQFLQFTAARHSSPSHDEYQRGHRDPRVTTRQPSLPAVQIPPVS